MIFSSYGLLPTTIGWRVMENAIPFRQQSVDWELDTPWCHPDNLADPTPGLNSLPSTVQLIPVSVAPLSQHQTSFFVSGLSNRNPQRLGCQMTKPPWSNMSNDVSFLSKQPTTPDLLLVLWHWFIHRGHICGCKDLPPDNTGTRSGISTYRGIALSHKKGRRVWNSLWYE